MKVKSSSSSSRSSVPKTDISIYKLNHKKDNVYDFELVYVYKSGSGSTETYKGPPKRKSVLEDVKVTNVVDAGIETDYYTEDHGVFIIPKSNTDFEGNVYYKALQELE